MTEQKIMTEKGEAEGFIVDLQGIPLIVIKAKNGYLACGYFNTEIVEMLEQNVVIVKGVKSFDEMLKGKISYVSSKAKDLGIFDYMTPKEALNRLM